MKMFTGFFALLAATSIVACDDGEPCDPDMERWGNYCVYPTEEPEIVESAGGEAGVSEEFFGVVCTEESESDVCGGKATTCAIVPGEQEGICSATGCESEPDEVVCPDGWSCFALGDVCLED